MFISGGGKSHVSVGVNSGAIIDSGRNSSARIDWYDVTQSRPNSNYFALEKNQHIFRTWSFEDYSET